MENMTNSQVRARTRKRNVLFSILFCCFCVAVLILPMQHKASESYSFDVAADIDLVTARDSYVQNDGNAELYRLLLAYCRQEGLLGSGFDADEFCECGRELYRRAKEGKLDLETIGIPEDTTAMLTLLRNYGVTPTES